MLWKATKTKIIGNISYGGVYEDRGKQLNPEYSKTALLRMAAAKYPYSIFELRARLASHIEWTWTGGGYSGKSVAFLTGEARCNGMYLKPPPPVLALAPNTNKTRQAKTNQQALCSREIHSRSTPASPMDQPPWFRAPHTCGSHLLRAQRLAWRFTGSRARSSSSSRLPSSLRVVPSAFSSGERRPKSEHAL